MTSVGWFAAGFGSCIGLVILLAVWVDVPLIRAGHESISRRTLDAGLTHADVAAVISAVLALVVGMLIGHLFLGQRVQ